METRDNTLKLGCKVWIESENGAILGKGGANLLKHIKASGSIKKAAEKIDWSYKFAWSYLKRIEMRTKPVVKTFKGGDTGGGATLTAWGEHLLETYTKIVKEVKQCLKDAERDFEVKTSSKRKTTHF